MTTRDSDEARRRLVRQALLWHWRLLLVAPVLPLIALALAVGVSDELALLFCPRQFESTAILEFLPPDVLGRRPPARGTESTVAQGGDGAETLQDGVANEVSGVEVRMLAWSAVREIILSRRVDFGVDVDPDDRNALESVYDSVRENTRLVAKGQRHLAVSHRSPDPGRNAALVNELVKRFVLEDRQERRAAAATKARHRGERLAIVRARLDGIERELLDLARLAPWLGDDPSGLHKELAAAERESARLRSEIDRLTAERDALKAKLERTRRALTSTREIGSPPEAVAARRGYVAALSHFEAMNQRYTPNHRLWQDAKRRLDQALAAMSAADRRVQVEETTIDNPEFARLQAELATAERELKRLPIARLAVDKRVAESQVKLRKAPELLAERRRLQEGYGRAKAVVDEAARDYEAAAQEFERLEAFARFRVLSYAGPDTVFAGGGSWGVEVRRVRSTAFALAAGMGVAVLPVLVVVLAVPVAARRVPVADDSPLRAGSGLGCLLTVVAVAVIFAAAAILTYLLALTALRPPDAL